MSEKSKTQPKILNHFAVCDDPRKHRIKHELLDVIVIVVLATLCGEEGWDGFYDWAHDKIEYLRRFLKLEHGIPSADTLRRVMERLNPDQFLKGFVSWTEEFQKRTGGQICIDGKALRKARHPMHIISAWSEENRLVLGAIKKDGKGQEIPAIEELLDVLIFKKKDVITIDAIGCQKAIVSKIRRERADYVIAVKKNQAGLWAELVNYFSQAVDAPILANCEGMSFQKSKRGRLDHQEVWTTNDLDWLPQREEWEGLQSVIFVLRKWTEKGQEYTERRYYISSLKADPSQFSHFIRRHWSIENELHWHLDVTFREDDSRIGLANHNLRHARTMALNLLRSDTTYKRGLKAKMRRCHRSETYLDEVLLAGNF